MSCSKSLTTDFCYHVKRNAWVEMRSANSDIGWEKQYNCSTTAWSFDIQYHHLPQTWINLFYYRTLSVVLFYFWYFSNWRAKFPEFREIFLVWHEFSQILWQHIFFQSKPYRTRAILLKRSKYTRELRIENWELRIENCSWHRNYDSNWHCMQVQSCYFLLYNTKSHDSILRSFPKDHLP